MITAAEAREKAANRNKNLIHDQMTKVEKEINDAINRGEFRCLISFPLHKCVVVKLCELGYSVNSGGRYNDVEYCIEWKGGSGDGK